MNNRKGDKLAIAFLRVSSRRQMGNTSHDVQRRKIAEHCQQHGLEIVDEIALVETASRYDSRKCFHEARDKALAENIRNFVFLIGDRETRNLTDNEELEILVRSGRIALHYACENKVIDKNSPDSDFFMRDVMAAHNKNFSRTLSSRVKFSIEQKILNGKYPFNRPPLGYVNRREKDEFGNEIKRGTVLELDPDIRKQNQVRKEFELFADGHSFKKIRDLMIENGFVGVSEKKKYHASAIEKRIKQPLYRGDVVGMGHRVRGSHPLFIEQNILDRVEARLLGSGSKHNRHSVNQINGIFSGGWLTCAVEDCRCSICYDPKKKKLKNGNIQTHEYYRCTNGKDVHPRKQYVAENKIWNQFEGAVDKITINDEIAQAIAKALNVTHQKLRDVKKRDMEEYRLRLLSLESREDQAYEHFQNKILDEDSYKRQIDKIRLERREFTNKLEGLQTDLDSRYLQTAQSVLRLSTMAKALWVQQSGFERRAFLEKILSNPKLNGPTLEYDLKKPFALLAQIRESLDWRPHGD